MRIIFICAPYRAKTPWLIEKNVRRAERIALHLWRLGAAVICPHTNTRCFQGAAKDEVWLAGYLAILARCDAIVLPAAVSISSGMQAEMREARRRGLPIFLWPDQREDITEWIAAAPR